VQEPDGSCVWYSDCNSANGGRHNGDLPSGGTEGYTIVSGPADSYTIREHYHGSPQTPKVHIFGNNGSVNFAGKTTDASF